MDFYCLTGEKLKNGCFSHRNTVKWGSWEEAKRRKALEDWFLRPLATGDLKCMETVSAGFLCRADSPTGDMASQQGRKEEFKWLLKYITSGNSYPRRTVGIWEAFVHVNAYGIPVNVIQYGCEPWDAQAWIMKKLWYMTQKGERKNRGRKAYCQILHKQEKNCEIKDSVSVLFSELKHCSRLKSVSSFTFFAFFFLSQISQVI